jgi:hypothetical protein
MKAADIPDEELLFAVAHIQAVGQMWANFTELSLVLVGYPQKVVVAKAARLMKRGLLTGCTCGCRGDLEVTTAGLVLVLDAIGDPAGETIGTGPHGNGPCNCASCLLEATTA